MENLKKLTLLILIGLLPFIQNCSKDEDAAPTSFTLGQNYGGGFIFYIDGTRKHGLIAAPASSEFKLFTWGCNTTSIPAAQNTSVGKGQENTTAILQNCTEANIAAKLCNDLVLDGYSDWFLPSKDELALIYENLFLKGIGGFTTGYWSSSQGAATTAWEHAFDTNNKLLSNKTSQNYVRAIRAF